MLNKSVARRYAEAFFSIARETGKVDELQQELEKLVSIIETTENLPEYFAHLLIPAKAKKQVAYKLLEDSLPRVGSNLLYYSHV